MVKFITGNTPDSRKKRPRTDAQKAAHTELDASRAANAARRLETRRKVVIGGALIARAKRTVEARDMLDTLKHSLTRPADRKLFED